MKAVVLRKPMDICVENIPEPKASEDFLVIDVKACGICGSDVRYYKGENPWAMQTCGKELPNPPNIVLGHEIAGVVREVLNPRYKDLIGKRVAVFSFKTCGKCHYCANGLYHLCKSTQHIGHGAGWGDMKYYPGGMAERCIVWNTNVFEIPEGISFAAATVLDPLSVALHALRVGEVHTGDDVLVMGTGPVGLLIAQAAKAFGANHVLCTDISATSLNMARKLGIERTVDVRSEDQTECVREVCGRPNVNVIFDTVGSAASQERTLKLLRESGRLVNLVANTDTISMSLMDIAAERKIISTANGRTEDYTLGIQLLSSGAVDVESMITHRISIDEIQHGMDMLLDREKYGAMKVVVEI